MAIGLGREWSGRREIRRQCSSKFLGTGDAPRLREPAIRGDEALQHRHDELARLTANSESGLVVPRVIGADLDSGLLAIEWRERRAKALAGVSDTSLKVAVGRESEFSLKRETAIKAVNRGLLLLDQKTR